MRFNWRSETEYTYLLVTVKTQSVKVRKKSELYWFIISVLFSNSVRQKQVSSFIANLYIIVLHLLHLLSKSVNESIVSSTS